MPTLKLEKEHSNDDALSVDDAHYPWGTAIDIEGDQITALGLDDATVGQGIDMIVKCFVKRISSDEDVNSKEGKLTHISLQMTEMSTESADSDLATKLYE